MFSVDLLCQSLTSNIDQTIETNLLLFAEIQTRLEKGIVDHDFLALYHLPNLISQNRSAADELEPFWCTKVAN